MDESCLRWANHNTTIIDNLHTYLNKEMFIDTTLVCSGKHFPVHRFVLASCSTYFEDIFTKTPCHHPFLILNDIESPDLEALLSYMYLGRATIPVDRLSGVLRAGKTLCIKGLEDYDDHVLGNSTPLAEAVYENEVNDVMDNSGKLSPKSLLDRCLAARMEVRSFSPEEDLEGEGGPPLSPSRVNEEENMELTTLNFNVKTEDPEIDGRETPRGKRRKGTTSITKGKRELNAIQSTLRKLSSHGRPLKGRKASSRAMGEVPVHSKTFNCPVCPYKSKYSGDLRKHLRTHTGEKPFRCGKCPFTTSDSSSLKSHMRMHLEVKPHRCDVCSFSAASSATLKKHLKVHSPTASAPDPDPDEHHLLQQLGLLRYDEVEP